MAWLIQALRPKGAYPVLILQGEQGSAKSTTERLLRALIDPSTAPLRTTPRNERDLIIAATNSWCAAFDNISTLPPWLSDALCRLSTGGGFSARELYTDAEEVLFDVTRPVILNGTTDVATRPDLLDRALVMMLPAIQEEGRTPEADLWRPQTQVADSSIPRGAARAGSRRRGLRPGRRRRGRAAYDRPQGASEDARGGVGPRMGGRTVRRLPGPHFGALRLDLRAREGHPGPLSGRAVAGSDAPRGSCERSRGLPGGARGLGEVDPGVSRVGQAGCGMTQEIAAMDPLLPSPCLLCGERFEAEGYSECFKPELVPGVPVDGFAPAIGPTRFRRSRSCWPKTWNQARALRRMRAPPGD